ncbi:disulfide bond formation protein DsbB [Parashewanella spongiae]|uniref:Disulfide bond formation protein B n=1 Tax=Parashewanella spongiae TaxID=342950 RepID=A0A3A6UHZ9_9GAMM|nr:disulfide bond formation protein DsbB [Parashewanella spongiae]MCL1077240.1 disulfide bond formation protein DsbB [Parashewanella spongiae]RJY18681.1 disulfide bond formation protein DsbB [Parashewanella spongiae]
MNQLTIFSQKRISWLLLIGTALGLEITALWFQYFMKLDPCVMCIYQRLAIFGIFAAGFIGFINPKSRAFRSIGVLLWGVSAAWGLKVAIELVQLQSNPSPFATCSFLPEFPNWMPLHEWLPSVFMPTGMCSDSPWSLFNVTMGEWMVVVFIIYIITFGLFSLPSLFGSLRKD